MYKYHEIKPQLFSDNGQRTFLKIRDKVESLLRVAGAVRMQEAMDAASGDNWTRLACVDRMVELGELREITTAGTVRGQDRVFVAA